MSSPRTSKTVLGTLRFARVPRTVFEVLGLDIPQGPSEKRGTLAQSIVRRGDSHCLCFPGSVVEEVVDSGQKMAEEALFQVK